METKEKNEFLDEFKRQWKSMWRNRVDDKVRAEGIADKDYSLLFIDKGTVIIATRKFKLLDFYDLLKEQKSLAGIEAVPVNPLVGGWGRFIKTALSHDSRTRHGRKIPQKPVRRLQEQQLKKGGRGWLHVRR